jgi:hypothetical protein
MLQTINNVLQEHISLAFNLGTEHMFIDAVMVLEKFFHSGVKSYHYIYSSRINFVAWSGWHLLTLFFEPKVHN